MLEAVGLPAAVENADAVGTAAAATHYSKSALQAIQIMQIQIQIVQLLIQLLLTHQILKLEII